MVDSPILVIAATAATLGLVHTVLGTDHYLPFIVIGRARRWSLPRTLLVALICGIGHVLGSVALGFAGIALGITVFKLEGIESLRGEAAAWLLVGFGLAYCFWGLRRALRNKTHKHVHMHDGGAEHEHLHTHDGEHIHVHDGGKTARLTPWILFTIFVFGPCEPLIPLVMYPAAQHDFSGVVLVTMTFGLSTILTTVTIVAVSAWGVSFLHLGRLERYVHALAGAMIFVSGLGVQFLGL
jgi:ABC-type nickel/cobalt efflux system permease component RcnA